MKKNNKWYKRLKCKECKKVSTRGGRYILGIFQKQDWKINRCVCGKIKKAEPKLLEKSEKDSQNGLCG